jgi:hypothetical protein
MPHSFGRVASYFRHVSTFSMASFMQDDLAIRNKWRFLRAGNRPDVGEVLW